MTRDDEKSTAIPIIQEQVQAEKRRYVTGTVRVATHVTTHDQTVDVPLTQEHVDVERVRIDRPIDHAVEPRQEGDTWIIPVIEEVLVVEKRLVLREEIRLTKRRKEVRDPQTVTLRATEVTMERQPADPENAELPK